MEKWVEQLLADKDTPRGVQEILQRKVFREQLLAALDGEVDPRKLRQLAMGVWLDLVNAEAVSENGSLQIRVTSEGVQLAEQLDESDFFVRQAVLRQIERHVIATENGLFDRRWDSVLDVGAGGLALEAELRPRNPGARMIAFEPGLIPQKVKKVASTLNVDLRNEEFTPSLIFENFDLIVLHFLLEHDEQEAGHILERALTRLKPNGCISIAVPNFEAKHRYLDLQRGLNNRDPKTRLSLQDHLAGHELLFTSTRLAALIENALHQTNLRVPYSLKTILPREFAFNTMAAQGQHRALLGLHKAGHKPGEEGQGSVLLAKVGRIH